MLRRRNGSVSISGGFLLLLAWFAVVNGWKLLVLVLGSAAVHELGHCFALWSVGGQVRRLELSVLGAMLESNSACLSYGKELFCVLAGPMANFLCAAAAVIREGEGWLLFSGANLALCCFNLLPVRPLDGGRALELLLTWSCGQSVGEAVTAAVSAGCAAVLGAAVIWLMWRSGGSLWLLPAALGFLGTAWRESFGK